MEKHNIQHEKKKESKPYFSTKYLSKINLK